MLTHRPFRVTDDCLTRSPESDCHSRAPLIQLPGHVCPRIAPGPYSGFRTNSWLAPDRWRGNDRDPHRAV